MSTIHVPEQKGRGHFYSNGSAQTQEAVQVNKSDKAPSLVIPATPLVVPPDDLAQRVSRRYLWQGLREYARFPENGNVWIYVDGIGFTTLHLAETDRLEWRIKEAIFRRGEVFGFCYWLSIEGDAAVAHEGFCVRDEPIIGSYLDWTNVAYALERAYGMREHLTAQYKQYVRQCSRDLHDECDRFKQEHVYDVHEEAKMSVKIRVYINPKHAIKAKKATFGNVEVTLNEHDIAALTEQEADLFANLAEMAEQAPALGKGFAISADGASVLLKPESEDDIHCEDEPILDATPAGVKACLAHRLATATQRATEILSAADWEKQQGLATMRAHQNEIIEDVLKVGADALIYCDASGAYRVLIPVVDHRLASLVAVARALAVERNTRRAK